MTKPSRFTRVFALGAALSLVAVGCGSDGDGAEKEAPTTSATNDATTTAPPQDGPTLEIADDDAAAVATTYADLAFAVYDDNVTEATELQTAIDAFVAAPSQELLDAAKEQWLAARDVYGPSEAFRFYDGPIDNPEDGPEGQINAWPMDEAYVDYVEDDPEAGIINDVAGVPEITVEVITEANEQGGETNVSTGWHAIEFLLWGQDLSEDGPGQRPVTDYTTAANAERRGAYLSALAQLLVDDLTSVRDQWDPETGDYRTTFIADPSTAISSILRSMGALSAGELGGERIAVAYETKEQEDEHSCFSDNTIADIVGNAKGIRMVYTADHDRVDGTSLSEVIAGLDADLDASLVEQLDANVAAAERLPGPFDTLIQGDDDSEGRQALLALSESLQAQGDAVADLARQLGYEISIEI